MSLDTSAQAPNHGNGNLEGERHQTVDGRGSGSAQQQAQLAALLSFKPSSRDVIGGIAPHVFEDQRSPYRPRHRRRATSPDCRHRRSSSLRRSPLRLSAVIVDENGAIIQPKLEDNVLVELYTTMSTPSLPPVSPPADAPAPVSLPTNQNNKSKRRGFRIDRVLKTLVLRLK